MKAKPGLYRFIKLKKRKLGDQLNTLKIYLPIRIECWQIYVIEHQVKQSLDNYSSSVSMPIQP